MKPMDVDPKSRRGIVIVGIACVAAIGIVRYLVQKSDTSTSSPRPQTVTLKGAVLGSGACSEGKVISAIRDGKVVASYTCTSQDAAVAWVSVNAVHLQPVLAQVSSAKDERNQNYPMHSELKNGLNCLLIPAGFSRKPAYIEVTVPLSFASPLNHTRAMVFRINDIAAPIRRLTMPPPDRIREEERAMRVTIDELGNVRSTEHGDAHHVVNGILLATSYCPEGSKEPDLHHYGQGTDLIKVKLDTYQLTDSYAELTYKNASVAIVNGVRTLRLPTTQDVGVVVDAKATIPKRVPIPNTKSLGVSTGDLFVQLARRNIDKPWYDNPTLSLASITPSADQIGINPLKLRLGGYAAGANLRPSKGYKGPLVSDIPELKIKIKISTPKLISSEIYVLPLHHIKAPQSSRVPQNPGPARGFAANNGSLQPSLPLYVSNPPPGQ